jgi:hypothetical protein
MNAYELADEFRSNAPASEIFDWCHKSANMLRQQADTAKEQGIVNRALMERILELEKEKAELEKQLKLADDEVKRLNNALYDKSEKQSEPVAWVYLENWLSGDYYPDDCFAQNQTANSVPLYTTPQTKPLSDEEILVAHVPLMAWEVFSSSLFRLENNEITNDEFIKRCYEVVKARCNHPQPDYTQSNTQLHPQTKPLSDEELNDFINEHCEDTFEDRFNLLKAFERKVREKK